MIHTPRTASPPLQLSLFPEPPRPSPKADSSRHRSAATVPAEPRSGTNADPGGPVARPAPPTVAERGELHRRLNHLLDGRLKALVLTDNRSRILTASPARGREGREGGLDLRLDRSFVGARRDVLVEVAAFCLATSRGRRDRERRRRALEVIRDHFEANRRAVAAPRRRAPLVPRGERFDLTEIRDRLNRRWFGGRLASGITWGRDRAESGRAAWGCRRRRTTIQLGSYSHEDDVIRVHPALDRRGVPEYVVGAVVFHELLHAALPPVVRNGRRLLHTAEFRRRERQYPDHARAERWIAANLGSLLRRA